MLGLLLMLAFPLRASAAEDGFDMSGFIFGHISDSYEWHITTVGQKEIAIPLPCIVIDGGLKVFSYHNREAAGYTLNSSGKLVNAATGRRPLDISITKNVLGLIIDSILLIVLILLDNDPIREFAGEDQQLEKAVEVALEQIKDRNPLPGVPAPRTFKDLGLPEMP